MGGSMQYGGQHGGHDAALQLYSKAAPTMHQAIALRLLTLSVRRGNDCGDKLAVNALKPVWPLQQSG